MKIKYDSDALKTMLLFESITHVKLRDFFKDSLGVLNFVVDGKASAAIGKNGFIAKKIEARLRKPIRIFQYSQDLEQFIRNLLRPLEIESALLIEGGNVNITATPQSRGYIIGRAAQNLRNYESIVKRYFRDVVQLRVL